MKLLKYGQILLSGVVKKKIMIVQAWQDESSDSVSTSIKFYEYVDHNDVTNLPVYWLTQAGDVIWYKHMAIKIYNTQITDLGRCQGGGIAIER